jgi:hypothetical protein
LFGDLKRRFDDEKRCVIFRPPQLPPKPAVKIVGRTKIFGGNLDVLAKVGRKMIKLFVWQCNLWNCVEFMRVLK